MASRSNAITGHLRGLFGLAIAATIAGCSSTSNVTSREDDVTSYGRYTTPFSDGVYETAMLDPGMPPIVLQLYSQGAEQAFRVTPPLASDPFQQEWGQVDVPYAGAGALIGQHNATFVASDGECKIDAARDASNADTMSFTLAPPCFGVSSSGAYTLTRRLDGALKGDYEDGSNRTLTVQWSDANAVAFGVWDPGVPGGVPFEGKAWWDIPGSSPLMARAFPTEHCMVTLQAARLPGATGHQLVVDGEGDCDEWAQQTYLPSNP